MPTQHGNCDHLVSGTSVVQEADSSQYYARQRVDGQHESPAEKLAKIASRLKCLAVNVFLILPRQDDSLFATHASDSSYFSPEWVIT